MTAHSTRNTRAKRKELFLAALRNLPDVSKASKAAGVDRKTVYDWRHNDPAFAEAWEDALESTLDEIEGVGHRLAIEGNPQLIMFWLERRRQKRFAKHQPTDQAEAIQLAGKAMDALSKLYEAQDDRPDQPDAGPPQGASSAQ